MKIRVIGLMLGIFVLGACTTSSPVKKFEKGDQLAFYDFTSPSSFEVGLYGNNTARLNIANGVYNIQLSTGDNTIYYGQWGDTLSDVVIEVDTNQTSIDLNSTYGVMCRMRGTVGQAVTANLEATSEATDASGSDTILASADATAEATAVEVTAEPTQEAAQEATAKVTNSPDTAAATQGNTSNNGDGYLFMIQGNGRYAILRSQGHKITPLVNWTSSDVIKMGAAQNRIKAICAGNYLALYVNDTFLADTSDDLYTKGQVGLVGASAGRTGMNVTFDNLSVFQVKSG